MVIARGGRASRVALVALVTVAAVLGSTRTPVDAGALVEGRAAAVDEVEISVTAEGVATGSRIDGAGPLTSGDIDVTDSDLDTEARTIRGSGQLQGVAGAVTVEFDLRRVLGVSPFWNGTVTVATGDERLEATMVFGAVRRDGDTYTGEATARRDGGQVTVRWRLTDLRRGPGDHAEIVSFGDQDRRYFVRTPGDYTGERPLPLVVFNHGAGSPWGWLMDVFMGLREFADDEGFIVVMPEARHLVWQFWPGRQVDDLGFMDLVLDEVQADYAVDPDRIYMMGHSNGGMLTHQYACARPGRVAAYGSVGGPLADPATCPDSSGPPAPFLIMQGTRDPLVPWDGWFGAISTPTTVEHWRRHNGCDGAATVIAVPDRDPGDGSTVRVHDHPCPAGADVVVHEVIGGGHQWFGGGDILPPSLLGNNNHDQVANEVFWDFFSRFRL